MPIFEYLCLDCKKSGESLIINLDEQPKCGFCDSSNVEKLLSAHSSMSGPTKNTVPGLGDTACCGSSPNEATGCAGPGSCCGKNFA
jgi:hypothetical protein